MQTETDTKGLMMLALTWQRKGEFEKAIGLFQRLIEQDPHHVEAQVYLAQLYIKLDRPADALVHMKRAAALNPSAAMLKRDVAFLERLVNPPPVTSGSADWPSNPDGRLKFRHTGRWEIHRSGWGLGMNALRPLHNQDGILFDGFLEDLFAWKHKHDEVRTAETLLKMFHEHEFDHLATSEEKGQIPYTEPWIGFLHNPPNMPAWFHGDEAPQSFFKKPVWQKSMAHCKGLFTLSNYHADWLRQMVDVPVSSLILPTEIPDSQFDFDRFQANPAKKIVQIGWWLRQQSAIYQLPVWEDNRHGYTKMRLIPKFFDGAETYLQELLKLETQWLDVAIDGRNLTEQTQISNEAYDELLSQNVVFVSLFDASANNTVVECIARATPILVNRHPAVIEYLGEDYPLFYSDFDDAAAKINDLQRVSAAHDYLKTCPTREKLSADYFRKSFEESDIYQLIN